MPKKVANAAAHPDPIARIAGDDNETLALDELQEVSVSFLKLGKPVVVVKGIQSLFDTGSSVSFINESIVPVGLLATLAPSQFRGLGNSRLYTRGQVTCRIKFKEVILNHSFIILPENSMAWPIIIGRDLLPSFNVSLTYSKNYVSFMQPPRGGIETQSQDSLDVVTNEISAIDVYESETELDVGPTLSSKQSAIVLSIIKENYLDDSIKCTQLINHKMKIPVDSLMESGTKLRKSYPNYSKRKSSDQAIPLMLLLWCSLGKRVERYGCAWTIDL